MESIKEMISHYKHILLAVLLSLFLLTCGTYLGSLPTPEQLAKSGHISEDLDMASLKRGRALAMTECVGCHRFFYPEEYSSKEWNETILKKTKRLSLGKDQIQDIGFYYMTMSTVTR